MDDIEERVLAIMNAAAEGLISVPELLGFTDDDAERLYDSALSLYERGATSQAELVLEWVVNAKPYTARYWTAYAATLQAREAFVPAIRLYTVALTLDPDDVIALAHRGECCLLVGLVERGLDDLGRACAQAPRSDERRHWVEHARRLLALHEGVRALAPVA
ncbi:MAG: hypothetical protein RMA76_18005 [Deltaproteobacteria bacterium]